jgi:hypothetical protein
MWDLPFGIVLRFTGVGRGSNRDFPYATDQLLKGDAAKSPSSLASCSLVVSSTHLAPDSLSASALYLAAASLSSIPISCFPCVRTPVQKR